jgi:hypothetical protein
MNDNKSGNNDLRIKRGISRFEQNEQVDNDYIETIQGLDNRLTLENLSYAEDYLNERFSIVCDLRTGGEFYRVKLSAMTQADHRVFKNMTVAIHVGHAPKGSGRESKNGHVMLISNVELVQGTQGIIPSHIWFYFVHDEISQFWTRSLYFSTLHGVFKFLPGVSEWELYRVVGVFPVIRRTISKTTKSRAYRKLWIASPMIQGNISGMDLVCVKYKT